MRFFANWIPLLLSQYIIFISRNFSNNYPKRFCNQTAPQLAMLATMYSTSVVIKAMDFYFLFTHDIIVDPKKHSNELFQSIMLSGPIISESMQTHLSKIYFISNSVTNSLLHSIIKGSLPVKNKWSTYKTKIKGIPWTNEEVWI